MKIKMLQGLAGASYSLAPGEVPPADQFTDKEAKRLIKAGIAEEVKESKEDEAALRRAEAAESALVLANAEVTSLKARVGELEALLANVPDNLAANEGTDGS